MNNSSKIFVSSSSQPELRIVREKLHESLKEAGHNPLLFEDNGFGIYSPDSIEDCLKKVRQCDIFILLISNKAGSFTPKDPNITVTYAEYATAVQTNKIIIPVIDTDIFSFYREHLKDLITEKYENYRSFYDSEPEYTSEIVSELISELSITNSPLHKRIQESGVDDFIWSFIFDVYGQNTWTYDYTIQDPEMICKFVKESLSKILQEVAPFFNQQYEVKERLAAFQNLTAYKESVPLFLQCIQNGELNLKLFLKTLSDYLSGGEIQKNTSAYIDQPLTTISNCLGITLYKRISDNFELMGFIGAITPDEYYQLNDEDSFVSATYWKNTPETEHIFYSESKQMVYLTKKRGELILTCHFQLGENWSSRRVEHYERQVLSAIMDEREQFDLAVDILGGMYNG